jgi:hypothetical protein
MHIRALDRSCLNDPTEVTDLSSYISVTVRHLGVRSSFWAKHAAKQRNLRRRGVLASCDFSEQTNQAQSGEGDPDAYPVGYPGEPLDPAKS